ncbi:MAG: MGH1-like glycoside hydrolase domain-containing protein, partial [Planctomycetota bacterium]
DHYMMALDALWHESIGLYLNRDTGTGAWIERLGPTLFYPLLTGRVPAERQVRMLDAHLCNSEEFWGDYPVPTIARNDPAFADQSYWRGRVWAPTNLLVYLGLIRAGAHQVAQALACKGNAMFLRNWRERGIIGENYNGIDGSAGERSNSDPFNSWGALLALVGLDAAGAIPPLPR